MLDRINIVDAAVRQQHREIHDPVLRPKLTQFDKLLELAVHELTRREKNRGKMPLESEAMKARRLRTDADYAAYASDDNKPVPLEYWSTVTTIPRRVPISADDLRHALAQRKAGRSDVPEWTPTRQLIDDDDYENRPQTGVIRRRPPVSNLRAQSENTEDGGGPSGIQTIRSTITRPSPSHMDTDSDSASTGERPSRDASPRSYRSRSSIGSYISLQQPIAATVQRNIPLPPMLSECPVNLDRRDSQLIGRSEFYVRRAARGRGCPMCGESHRLHDCPRFLYLPLQERWYEALHRGLCLNCLRAGHSSFMCSVPGACRRCQQRHNSKLCPRHPSRR